MTQPVIVPTISSDTAGPLGAIQGAIRGYNHGDDLAADEVHRAVANA